MAERLVVAEYEPLARGEIHRREPPDGATSQVARRAGATRMNQPVDLDNDGSADFASAADRVGESDSCAMHGTTHFGRHIAHHGSHEDAYEWLLAHHR